MAIYSLHVSSVGRTTHASGTAGAHLLYISRPSAKPTLLSHAIPLEPQATRTWMDRGENADRKNARVADRIRLAIPRELTREQRCELVRSFCTAITGNRVPWFAALHQDGDDAHNPHTHIVVRDREIGSGKRVLRWSDSARDRKASGLPENAVDMIRQRWEVLANQALDRAGHAARIDRRSLEDQGIARVPTIHIGPNAAHIEEFVHRPDSKIVIDKRGGRDRVIDYPAIDAGRTRKDRHAEILDLNLERGVRSSDWGTRARAQFQKEEMFKDRVLERRLMGELRERTLEERRLRAGERIGEERIRKDRDSLRQQATDAGRAAYKKTRATQKERHGRERAEMKREQNRLMRKLLRAIDITGRTRSRHLAERKALTARQANERKTLITRFRERRDEICQRIDEKTRQRLAGNVTAFRVRKETLQRAHREAERHADAQRQARAVERDQAERRLEQQIKEIEQRQREAASQPQSKVLGAGRHAASANAGVPIARSQPRAPIAPQLKAGHAPAPPSASPPSESQTRTQPMAKNDDPTKILFGQKPPTPTPKANRKGATTRMDFAPAPGGTRTGVRETPEGQKQRKRAERLAKAAHARKDKTIDRALRKHELTKKFKEAKERNTLDKDPRGR